MTNYTFEDIKELLLKSIQEHDFESELSLCGNPKEASGEYNYESLDELYKAQQVDGIVLERDWGKVRVLECTDFDILGLWD